MQEGKFQIYKGHDNQFYFRLRARNGEIILASEAYTTKSACENGIESVKENSTDDAQYQCEVSKDNQYYFTLKAKNGEPIGQSEMYTSESARDNGIKAVKKEAPNATIETLELDPQE